MKKTASIIPALILCMSISAQDKIKDYITIGKNEINILFGKRKDKGYFNIMQAGILMGNEQATQRMTDPNPWYSASSSLYLPAYTNTFTRSVLTAAPSFTMTNGYMFNDHWAVGAGIGFEVFDHNLFPLFAELRYTLWDTEISPFAAMKGGYAFGNFKMKQHEDLYVEWAPYHVTDAGLRHYGGLMLNPEIGIKVPLNKNSDLLVSAAYRHQKTRSVIRKDYDTNQFDEWEHKEALNRISFAIGIMFR